MIVEAGSFSHSTEFSQLEHEIFPWFYQDKASRTIAERALQVHRCKGAGGSILHNINLCKTIPSEICQQWTKKYGLKRLSWNTLQSLWKEIQQHLSIT